MAKEEVNKVSFDKSSLKTYNVLQNVRFEYIIAGLSGGVASTLILHPLDLIKVRFQVNEGLPAVARPQYSGIGNALLTVCKQDGFTGLYRGVTPNVWGAGASWGFYFFIYNNIKLWMQDGDSQKQLSPASHMIAGFQAGACTLTLTNPLWVTKTRMCLQYSNMASNSSTQYTGMFKTLSLIYKENGIRGWYKGYLPGIFGVSHGALQFMAYDEMKNRYNVYRQKPIGTEMRSIEYITFAALSKMFAVITTYPYQVVRSRLQDQHRQYSGAMDVIHQTWRNESFYGFYKGMTANLLRVTPACCITFLVYETVVTWFRHLHTK